MAKFKVLKQNQIVMSRLTEPKNEFFTSFAVHIILFFLIYVCIILSGLWIYKNFAEFSEVIQSMNIFIGGIQSSGMFLSYGLKMKQVKQLHLKLQGTVDQSKWN